MGIGEVALGNAESIPKRKKDCVPADANANVGTKRGRELLAKSLAKYGTGRSVLVDKNNRVIAGNKTVEQARAAGMKSIAVIEGDGSLLVAVQRGDLDLKKDKRAKELAIADNRVAELDLEWNPEVLASLDADLKEFWNESELTKVLGEFGPAPLEAPEPKLDQAAALQRKWGTANGQIWQIGRHRLMCGDCTEPSDVRRVLRGIKAEATITDPPYNVEIEYGWCTDNMTPEQYQIFTDKWFALTKESPSSACLIWG